ncbi:putative rhamnogalacturonate lyase C [Vanrija pseudolonga]|uniref:Rhamnogalacturonate lyase C n=1 Tax=Vanrija pseudolonga TaxID=143232 RepID=A0AAF0Y9N1_9TREE|nr:putative rhamnogalacturonate lyase C [Vanrija pseudolonga]
MFMPIDRFTAWEHKRRNLLLWFCRPAPPADPTSVLAAHLPPEKRITAVCISDTHNTQPDIPDGDVLFHSGDLTSFGTAAELQAQLDWLASLPHRYKVVIPGNHDKVLDETFVEPRRDLGKREDLNWHDLTYLLYSSVTLEFPDQARSLKVYGDPLTPAYGGWAFQHRRKEDTWRNTVPAGTDVLLSHGPPLGHLDDGKGSPWLLRELRRARPRLLVFGHIHESRGTEVLDHSDWDAWARDRLNQPTTPGILEVVATVVVLLVGRIYSAVVGRRAPQNTVLVNAASMGRMGLRDNPSEAAGTVIYI